MENIKEDNMNKELGKWTGIGLVLGVAIGSLMDNMGLGVAIGLVLGVAIGASRSKSKDDKENY